MQALGRLERAEWDGVFTPWTADIEQAYRPEAVARVLDEVIKACPDAGAETAFVDCEEFPCMVWVNQSVDLPNPALLDCEAWPYGSRFMVYSSRSAPDGSVSKLAVFTVAPEGRITPDLERRLEFRRESLEEQVRTTWEEDGLVH